MYHSIKKNYSKFQHNSSYSFITKIINKCIKHFNMIIFNNIISKNNKKKTRIIPTTIALYNITFLLKNPIIESAYDLYLFQTLQHDEKKARTRFTSNKNVLKIDTKRSRGMGAVNLHRNIISGRRVGFMLPTGVSFRPRTCLGSVFRFIPRACVFWNNTDSTGAS